MGTRYGSTRRQSDHEWEPTLQLDAEALEAAWNAYWDEPTDVHRNRLMEHYLPVVKHASEWLHSRLPAEVELDDVISAGIVGLRKAIGAFDPERNVKFETYASTRIRGAILDSLRRMDWVPRLVRSRTNKLARSRDELRSELGRPPSTTELAAHMGVPQGKVTELARSADSLNLLSLDHCCYEDESGHELREADFLRDEGAPAPDQEAQSEDLRRILTNGLSDTERTVVVLYYYEEMTMKEIGATLGISESRVSQLHSAVMERLRTKMRGRECEFAPAER